MAGTNTCTNEVSLYTNRKYRNCRRENCCLFVTYSRLDVQIMSSEYRFNQSWYLNKVSAKEGSKILVKIGLFFYEFR